MRAQWENGCISLSVLSMTRVMIAQWENEGISLSVLSMTRVMIAQWENEGILLSVLSVARFHSQPLCNISMDFSQLDHNPY